MGAEEVPRRELIILLPLEARGAPLLQVEKSTFGRVGKEPVRIVTLSRNIGVELPVTELGSEQALRASEITMLRGNLKAALVKIRRSWLRREGVESEVIQPLRIECQ